MSSNTSRNPKELREFIEKSKNNDKEIEKESLFESEYEKMKLKLEEQTKLLEFYKNRGHEYVHKNKSLEKLNRSLVEQKSIKFLRIDSIQAQLESQAIDESLSRIEKQENELLKRRIEEQMNLITFYKNRGDETLQKNQNLENIIQSQSLELDRLSNIIIIII